MSKLSVPGAAERLGVSPARVRQRIDNGSLVAEKIGGRWLVDLEASPAAPRAGRPVAASSVWWSIAPAERAEAVEPDNGVADGRQPSRSSQDRAMRRISGAVTNRDHDALLAWLSSRASRHLYVAAPDDLEHLRADERLVISGVSHPVSGMEDLRVAEGYVRAGELDAIAAEYWLERPRIDDRPNVVLHASPDLPSAIVPLLLAADLFEHRRPREVARAHELLDEWIDARLLHENDGEQSA